MHSWLKLVESTYHAENPYHNSTHAADVLQAVACLLRNETLNAGFTDLEMVALLVGAACHDMDHPGTNNSFEVHRRSKLALLYNDRAVLENHHASLLFRATLGAGSRANLFAGLDDADFVTLRKLLVEVILSTDMAEHFTVLERFRALTKTGGVDVANADHRRTVSSLIIKLGDVSNPARAPELATEWTSRVMEEFFAQGDAEAEAGYPVSMFMDRTITSTSKCQASFISFIVLPLMEAANDYAPIPHELQRLRGNLAYWERERERETAGAAAATSMRPNNTHLALEVPTGSQKSRSAMSIRSGKTR